ncbi:MAG: hypothetical protein QMC89_00965 [Candidatus Hodarchaeaceae archaeon]|nr:hypothetical protein [Candidatus Hodarchaeaceae archaeon]
MTQVRNVAPSLLTIALLVLPLATAATITLDNIVATQVRGFTHYDASFRVRGTSRLESGG